MAKNSGNARLHGDGRVFLRGKRYWISYYHRGREIRESAKTTDETKALKFLRQRMKEVGADQLGAKRFIPGLDKIHVNKLLTTMETAYRRNNGRSLPSYLSHLKPIREFFGDMRAVDVDASGIDRYIDNRIYDGRANATINRELDKLRRAFSLAGERGELSVTLYVPKLKEAGARQGFFERPELEAVVSNLPRDRRDFTRFAYLVGWRKGEIRSLGWTDIEYDARILWLRGERAKNGEPRRIALEGELRDIFDRRWKARRYTVQGVEHISPLVFHRKGKPIGDFRKAWGRACYKAGLPCTVHYRRDGRGDVLLSQEGEPLIEKIESEALFHDLRRTAVRNMVRAGVDRVVAKAISGHRTDAIFDRYNITSDDDLKDAVLQIDTYVRSQPVKRQIRGLST